MTGLRFGRRLCVAGLLLLAVSLGKPAIAAGSWVADRVTPTVHQQGRRYASEVLAPRATTPLGGTRITRVSWRYGFSRWIPELAVQLCGGGRCVAIDAERGQSAAFAGLPPATRFRFYFLIAGRPAAVAPPLYGKPLQLVVNFE